ncbi:hypothetical protein DPMN_102658 [Dreissena polymorpha]|uniref:Uncharacterized protein n=1 Tax=Dreissena polymorpha TaxID=45954 RepID=A0A9D4LJF1_DREPO|nr:hypothetical protein DPMN_102658 [Dreissena polymorpha]
MSSSAMSPDTHSVTGQSSPSVYFGLSRRGRLTSLTDSRGCRGNTREVIRITV